MERSIKNACATAALVLVMSAPSISRASIIISAVETGGNVIFSYSGTIDLTGLGTPDVTFSPPADAIGPVAGAVVFANSQLFDGWNNPAYVFPAFGDDIVSVADSATGTGLGVFSNGFGIANGYVSLSAISGSMTFDNETFASIGLTQGTYVANLPSDTLTLNIGVAQVPEPTTLALLGLGLAGLGFSRRKRDKN